MTTELQSFDRVADRMIMHFAGNGGKAIVVEGPGDWIALREGFQDVAWFPVAGKENVIQAVKGLRDNPNVSFKFVAIVDRDFDDPWVDEEVLSHTFSYPNRDQEAALIELGALWRYVYFHASPDKLGSDTVTALLRNEGVQCSAPTSSSCLGCFNADPRIQCNARGIVKLAKKRADLIAKLRWKNARKQWGLVFDQVDLSDKVDKSNLDFDWKGYCQSLASTVNYAVNVSTLENLQNSRFNEIADIGPRGKDVLAFVAVAMRKLLADLDRPAVAEQMLIFGLRLAGCELLLNSIWGQSIRDFLSGD